MMKMRLNDIQSVITKRIESCTDSLKKILINEDYAEKTLLVGKEYKHTIEAGDKCFNFNTFRILKGIVAKCKFLAAHHYIFIDPEEYFDTSEQMQISKALLASIANVKANEEFAIALWNWIFELGMPCQTEHFDWDKFVEQEKNESYV